jgi:hypothetical protein
MYRWIEHDVHRYYRLRRRHAIPDPETTAAIESIEAAIAALDRICRT